MYRAIRAGLVVALLSLSACGGTDIIAPVAPTVPVSPILAANVASVSSAVFDLPGCQAKRQLATFVGLNTTTCPTFTGTIKNFGLGCAANVHGTTTVYFNSRPAASGSSNWTYGSLMRPGEQVVYTGGPITVPSWDAYFHGTAAVWDSVRCP